MCYLSPSQIKIQIWTLLPLIIKYTFKGTHPNWEYIPRKKWKANSLHYLQTIPRLNIVFLKLVLCIPAVFTESFALYFGYVILAGTQENGKAKKKKKHPCSSVIDIVLECLSLSFKIKDMLISALFKTLLSYTKKLVFIWWKVLMLQQKLFLNSFIRDTHLPL